MAPNSNDYDVALRIGRLEGEVAQLKAQNVELIEMVQGLREDFANAKGGVRTIIAIGSVVSALGAVVAWGVSIYFRLTGHH